MAQAVGAQNFIDYITISTTGNATDFGDCIFEIYYSAGASDATKGYCAGEQEVRQDLMLTLIIFNILRLIQQEMQLMVVT